VGGGPGLVALRDGRAVAVAAFRIAGGRVVAIDILADPARLAAIRPLRQSPTSPGPPA
jgi:RNA polymerase sigma-70 factor (ECF subfamily)